MTSSLSSILPPFSLHNTFPLLGLITSTGALTYAYAEIVYLTPLTDERVPEHVIRTSWEHSFYPGLGAILTLGAGSLVGGITGYKMAVSKAGSGSGSMAKVLYATGTVLSMVHFVFVPWVSTTPPLFFSVKKRHLLSVKNGIDIGYT